MAGYYVVILAICGWWIDGLGLYRAARPLVIMGMNAIVVYMVSELLDGALVTIRWKVGDSTISAHDWLYRSLFAPLGSPINASLFYAIAYTLLMYLLAYVMYRRSWFPRV